MKYKEILEVLLQPIVVDEEEPKNFKKKGLSNC